MLCLEVQYDPVIQNKLWNAQVISFSIDTTESKDLGGFTVSSKVTSEWSGARPLLSHHSHRPSQEHQCSALSYALPRSLLAELSNDIVWRTFETRPALIESAHDTLKSVRYITGFTSSFTGTLSALHSTLRIPLPPSNTLQNNTTAQFPAITHSQLLQRILHRSS